MPKMYTVA